MSSVSSFFLSVKTDNQVARTYDNILQITINRYCLFRLLFVSLHWKRGKTFRGKPFAENLLLSLYFLSMKKFILSIVAAIALPMGLQAQRAVRWTLGVTTPIVSNTPTAFKYVGFSVKASYEKIRNVELGLSISSEGSLRKVNTSGSVLAQSVPYSSVVAPYSSGVSYSSAVSSFLFGFNGTYRWSPENFISPLAGVAVGVSNDALARGDNFSTSAKWSGFVAPHVGVMLGKHLDVRFSYYLAPKDFNRGMLSLGYKF